MLALVLVAASVGFSNLAASIGIGAGGADQATRLRLVLIFGLLEAGMPIVGLVIGHGLASAVDLEARWIAAALLVAIGGYGVVRAVGAGGLRGFRDLARRADRAASDRAASGGAVPVPLPADGAWRPAVHAAAGAGPGPAGPPGRAMPAPGRPGARGEWAKLLVSGFALSLDNLVAGFALGAFRVGVLTGAVVFGMVSTLMSLAGLELGARIGARSGESGELIGGAVLIGVGVAIGCGALG